MTESELSIAQQLGASAFLVYSVLKTGKELTRRELEMTCNLSNPCIKISTDKLLDTGIIESSLKKMDKNPNKFYVYRVKDSSEWRLQ